MDAPVAAAAEGLRDQPECRRAYHHVFAGQDGPDAGLHGMLLEGEAPTRTIWLYDRCPMEKPSVDGPARDGRCEDANVQTALPSLDLSQDVPQYMDTAALERTPAMLADLLNSCPGLSGTVSGY